MLTVTPDLGSQMLTYALGSTHQQQQRKCQHQCQRQRQRQQQHSEPAGERNGTILFLNSISLFCRDHGLSWIACGHYPVGAILALSCNSECNAVQVSHLMHMKTPLWLTGQCSAVVRFNLPKFLSCSAMDGRADQWSNGECPDSKNGQFFVNCCKSNYLLIL